MERPFEAEAAAAFEQVAIDPGAARERAAALVAAATQAHAWAAGSLAARALGLAHAALNDLDEARTQLQLAIRLARRGRDVEREGEARMSLSRVLAQTGRTIVSLREIEAAIALVSGPAQARAIAQRGAIRQHAGRLDGAAADYASALHRLDADDVVWRQRVLMNRGMLHTTRHAHAAATDDLLAADALCAEHGMDAVRALVQENLVGLARTRGDVSGALDHLDRAERLVRQVGASLGPVMWERAELLLQLNLTREARAAAEVAVAEHLRTDRPFYATDARLLLARTCLVDDPDYALTQAEQARREFARQGRSAWRTLAEYAVLVCRTTAADARPPSVATVERIATALDASGWDLAAADTRLLLRHGNPRTRSAREARRESLQRVARLRTGPTAAHRIRGWTATALIRQERGEVLGANRAARAGLGVLATHRTALAATDLRARSSALGAELAAIGLGQALASGSPWQVMSWAEHGRAQHLIETQLHREPNPRVVELLAQLRAASAEAEQVRRSGGDPASAEREQARLERTIRELSWRAAPAVSGTAEQVSRGRVLAALGETALVQFVSHRGGWSAVVVRGGRARLVALGELAALNRSLDWVRFALERIARRRGDPSAALDLLTHVRRCLEAELVAPIVREIGDRPAVIVPTGGLGLLPWSIFAAMRGRALTVAPSVRVWLAVRQRPAPVGPQVVVAGPGLQAAEAEAEAVAAIHGVNAITGAAATVQAVARALSEAGAAHVVAHGAVRTDSPLFSTLRFADGPMTLYDLEGLIRVPPVLTLSACQGAGAVVLPGDEPLGFASAFLAGGAKVVVGSMANLPDLESRPLMVELHRQLAAGTAPAEALARVQAGIDPE